LSAASPCCACERQAAGAAGICRQGKQAERRARHGGVAGGGAKKNSALQKGLLQIRLCNQAQGKG
jgi:hypothetical protein